MKLISRIACALLVLFPILSAAIGWRVAPGILHPQRRELTPDLIAECSRWFAELRTGPQDFSVRAPDGALLRGWKVRAARPNGSWVLLFHGVADNRAGTLGYALFLLRAGYGVVMMDSRAHGSSEGAMTTYGWLERNDTHAVVDALMARESPAHLFALGVSMGAAIALQSAAVEPRLEAVVGESSFADLWEASYDYAGLQWSPWLGKTLFLPGAWTVIHRSQQEGHFRAAEVSPEKAVAARSFPVLLICDERDTTLPCRHAERIRRAARGPAELWRVSGAGHASAYGTAPAEFERRVLALFASVSSAAQEHRSIASEK